MENQARWDSLMKYKIWGTDSINIFKNVNISDTIGYNGTKGRLYLLNDEHVLGGPTIVGGNMVFDNSNHDQILKGPVRVEGNLRLGTQDYNVMEGTWCVQGSITSQYNDGDRQWNSLLQGPLYTNETSTVFTKKVGNYGACPEAVPPLEDLSVPYLSDNAWQGSDNLMMTSTSPETGYIHVPPDSVEKNKYGTYDKYYNNFVINGTKNKALYVLMPPGGKLTRIFSKNGFKFDNAVNDLVIQVVYVTEGTKFANGQWDLTNKANFTYVTNSDYSGNLLFYTNRPVQWNYWDGASFQGTWMTTDSIAVGGHFKLAGQIVARYIHFYAHIKGDFQYMPFDPPWIDINPEARTWGTLYEGLSGLQPLSISLNEAPTTDVTFKYCFIFNGNQANNRDTDPDSLNAFASLDDVVTSGIPICNGANSTSYETVTFPKGHKTPTKAVAVAVKDELIEEWGEMFTIRVFDMVGAVLPNKSREGEFLIEIVDDDKAPTSKDTVFVGLEDTDNAFVRFPAYTGNGLPLTDYYVKIESLPMHNSSVAGTLIYDGNVVDADAISAGLVIPSADLGKLTYRGNPNAYGTDVASFIFRIINKGVPAVSSNLVRINLNPVNDAPKVRDTTFTVKENVAGQTTPNAVNGKIPVTDVDDSQFKYAFDNTDANYAKVTSLYTINSKTGKISVKSGVLLNYESADSLLKIKVNVTDSASTTNGTGKITVKSTVTIQILDVNDKPVIRDTTLTVAENSPAGTEVGKVTATDEDTWKVLTFSLADMSGNSGAAQLFTINSDGMIKVATGAKLDYETKKEYKLYAIVTDNGASKGFTNLKDTAIVTIKITDKNDPPIIVDIKDNYNVVENTKTGTVFAQFKVVDVDAADGSTTLSATVKDKNPVSGSVTADQLFGASVAAYNGDTVYVKIFVKDSALLNYEALFKADTVSYNVTLSIKDANGGTGSNTVTADTKIFVTDENEVPTIDDGSFTVAENAPAGRLVGTVSASDPDTYNAVYKKLTYSLVGTSDRYAVASGTGKITVKQGAVIDYETTPNHKDTIKVRVKDGGGLVSRIATIEITITNTNENPELNCVTGDTKCNGPFEIAENSATGTVIHTFAISDVDGNDAGLLKVELADKNGSNAKTLFDVKTNDANTEMIVFVKDSSKLDYETVDAQYVVILTVKDAGNATDTLIRTIKVKDVNERPTISDKTVTKPENLPKDALVAELTATDPDTKHVAEFGHLDYSIITQNTPFWMDSNKVKVADSTKLDFETTPTIKFKVEVKNCTKNSSTGMFTVGCLTDTALVTVKLTNVNENPELKCVTGDTKCNGPFEIAENSATGTVIHTFAISDVDANDAGLLKVELADKNGGNAKTLFDVKTNAANTEMIVFVKDSSKLDYETVNAQYVVILTVKDAGNAIDTLIRTIKVKDVNERPTISDKTVTKPENLPKDALVAELTATDPDTKHVAEFGHLDYRIITQNMPFWMDSNKVRVADSTKLDFETTPTFKFKVEVKNCTKNASTGKFTEGCLADTADVTVKLSDVNENPEIIVDDGPDGDDDTDSLCIAYCDTTGRGVDPEGKKTLTVGVKENVPQATVVLSYVVNDQDAGDINGLKVKLLDNKNTGVDSLFKVDLVKDTQSGKKKLVITVLDSSKLDYETINPRHEVTIVLTDPDGLTDSLVRIIEVLDVNEPPTFESWPFEFEEHNEPGAIVGHVEHGVDVDTTAISGISIPAYYENDKFELTGGADGADTLFKLLKNGDLVALKRFNYETDPHEYVIYISLMDTLMPELVETDTVYITLLDINENPTILTDSVRVEENAKKGTVVDTLEAKDLDLYDTVLTFTLVKDTSGCFEVSKSGVITVKADRCKNLDYEKNPELPITVKATDSKGGSDTKIIAVKITDVNEAPEVDDQTIYVDEDEKIGTVIDTIEARDPDKDPKYSDITYTAIDGDTLVFRIDPKTGEVILRDTLDYEKKSEYKLIVEVSDGEYADTATVTIKVKNVYEQPKVDIIIAETVDSTWHYPDTLYINNKTLCIEWVAMNRVSEEKLKDSTECGIELEEGENIIIRKFEDPTMDTPGVDTLVVYVSTKSPVVTIRKVEDELPDPNIFTVVEEAAKSDTAFYVNTPINEIVVTVKDPDEKTNESFTMKLDLEPLKIPSKTYKTLGDIADFSIALSDKPSSKVTHTPVNGEKIAVSYTEKVNGKELLITYYTDMKGEPLENEDGVVEMTITCTENINGTDVKFSYQADAVTGAVIKTSGGYVKAKDSTGKAAENQVVYTVSYETVDKAGNVVHISYGVDAEGNIVRNEFGSIGYEVTYSFTNKYGNTATQSVFVVIDQVPPKVKILYPTNGEIIYSNFVDVKWTVDLGDGNGPDVQDTLVTQSLKKGGNVIVRMYRDKAGNIASDTVRVVMKNAKEVAISVEQPVTEISKDKVADYYAKSEPEEGETFAVTIYNTKSKKEIETLVGGDFETKEGNGDEPYEGLDGHLGPTLAIDAKAPTFNEVGGLATLDDLVSKEGLVMLDGVNAAKSEKMPVAEYVEEYCSAAFAEKVGSDLSRANLYETEMHVKIWIYTTLGQFVDYYSFTQELNDPDYVNDAGLLTLYFELKPDRDGNVRTKNGRLMATGAYIYKTEVDMRSELQCTLPPVKDESAKSLKKGDVRKVKEDMLKNFGYKRPEKK
ncbi:MAG: cadherin domain-containing protein [Fibrobacter sp.]|uniref:cadherin domain-containing protein n=1 Tax=Fibrobacter sp. TaxID=35828 RepID=UPI0025BB1497|nr:cadherin domain-containing protein [Fibrobacter sp.]MBR4785660.1 cadherin domain-containing protein [Fibrobacter sp.]